ncbi:SDR family NAD(P)-dependent oxidoreductase [Streptococcus porcinus]|uniref:Short chain dehydrogenase n=2 Tax=Streptococcus porcinus TaxID=1340 RepID=A0A4V6LY45_STRPO|nr:SDR family oxidoreductase [Streptococcus porcinus]EGJ27535.1 oxidoreductase, short chain dehydrogenase/reductase family protein [Streptococcus porcinus str. Jelinkova 176]SQG43728.1 short chain dehydrogenase [Streptococcus porcinus]VTT42869.1 short chain dehydrogenase [Streptococcus porcinus]VTT44455.1 short chain dehydrogenase [Streptococcus porcinus]
MTKRVILITGASGGLAQAIIKELPKTDLLLLLGRNKDKLESLYKEYPNKKCFQIDISDAQAINNLLLDIYQEFPTIDVVINNAGFGSFKSFDQYTHQEIEEMFRINTLASIDFARLIGVKMAEQNYGHIVNIVSMAGLVATSKSSVYAATKFAMIGYSNALRLELAEKNVYVTTINPGPIKTGFFDQADPSGQYLKSINNFALEPDSVAKKTVAILGKNKRELNLPWTLAVTRLFYSLFPRLSDYLARKVFNYK